MQKRSRRPHGTNTRKISLSVSADDLKVLVAHARRDHRGNVSAVVHDMVETLRRQAAMDRLLRRLGAHEISDEEMEDARAELFGARPAAAKPRHSPRRRAAA